MDTFRHDLRIALRRLVRDRAFTLTVLAILAVGIAAVTVVFGIVDAVLLEPLPYDPAGRLYLIAERETESGERSGLSYPLFEDLRAHDALGRLGAYRFRSPHLTGSEEPMQLRAAEVSGDFFAALGTVPARGRLIADGEAEARHRPVAVLGHALWQRLGGSDDIVGRTLELDGERHEVIGVLAAGDGYPGFADLWLPLPDLSARARDRRELTAIAQLPSGASPDTARDHLREHLRDLSARLATTHPDVHEGRELTATSLHEDTVGASRATLTALFAAVGGLLLIVCLNVAGLQTARGLAQRREVAIRSALGAGRWRVLRQLTTESVVLALAGGALGAVLASWSLDLILKLAPVTIPRLQDATIDGEVLIFAAAVSALTGVLFGLVPALQTRRLDLARDLKSRGDASGERHRRIGLRPVLVALQVALTLTLLVAAALLGRSFQSLLAVDLGLDVERLASLGFVLPPDVYPEPEQRVAWAEQVLEQVRAVPGVETASIVNYPPLTMMPLPRLEVEVPGASPAAGAAGSSVQSLTVGERFFATLGVPLRAGRTFDAGDRLGGAPVVVVNEAMARRAWPGRAPVGQTLRLLPGGGEPVLATVVGLVADHRHGDPQAAPSPTVYRAWSQSPWGYSNLVVRAGAGDPEVLLPEVQRALWRVDPARPLFQVQPLRQTLGYYLGQPRFTALLTGSFSLFALILAALGIYGTMAYAVRSRRREIGVRLALGARGRDVRRSVVGRAMALTAIGVALGLAGVAATSRLIAGLLFGVAPFDAPTVAAVALLLVGSAFLAAWLPAARAGRLDPAIVLRDE